jgi:flagellar biosynthesis protein FlhA
VLTIGDGVVTVIPALMISVSGGLIVTRASSEARLSDDVRKQLFSNSQPLMLASGVLLALALFPGLPKIPFLLMGSGLGYSAWKMRQKAAMQAQTAATAKRPAAAKENLETLLRVDLLAVEVGLGLVKMVEGGPESPLLRRIGAIRRQLATELGYLLPPVRVTDNLALRSREYVMAMKGAELARYELPQGCELAIPGAQSTVRLDGQSTREPAFGLPALWISADNGDKARNSGYTVVDPLSVLGTHLAEMIRRHAHELFSRQDTKKLLDRVALDNSKLVEDLVPKLLPMATVQRVLQNLLRERVSIRDAVSILEALGDAGQSTRNPVLLTEYVRQSIRRTVVKPYLSRNGELPAWFLDPVIEQAVESAVEHGEQNSHLGLAPQTMREILDRIAATAGKADTAVVALTTSGARYFLRQLVEPSHPNLVFLSHNEVPAATKVASLGVIR